MNNLVLTRRRFAATAISLCFMPVAAKAGNPWKASLVTGAFDGQFHVAGLRVQLQEGWKTYWRVPGQGGVAPSIALTGTNLKSFDVEYPLPSRMVSDGEEAIGYRGEVVFPLIVRPVDPTQGLNLKLQAFFGVCDTICIPAQYEAALDVSTASPRAEDVQLLDGWRAAVPALASKGPIQKASISMVNDAPALVLQAESPAADLFDDIFVEGGDLYYFRKPVFTGNLATLIVDGMQKKDELQDHELRITMQLKEGGIEQRINVA